MTSNTITLDRRALALATERLSPLEAKVLLVLLARCAPATGRLRTSIGAFAASASLPESLVRCVLPRLVAAGFIVDAQESEPTYFDISPLLARGESAPENLPVT